MRRRLFLILTVLSTANLARAAETVDLRQRLQTEAGTAWGEYLQLISHVRGDVRGHTTDLKTGETDDATEEVMFLVNGAAGLYETVQDGRRVIELANQEFQCSIAEPSTGKWQLQQLLWHRSPDKQIKSGFAAARRESDGIDSRADKLPIAYAGRGLTIQATWLPAMFVSPSFKITSACSKEDSGNSLVRVEFEYQPDSSRGTYLRNGWVELDPSRYWQIRRAEVQIEEPREGVIGTKFVENEFDDATVGFPYAAKSILRTRAASANVSLERETVYLTTLEQINRSDVTPFQLSTYGIKEPTRPVGE